MKPNFNDMMAFAEVVETGSFTAAAERLGRGKSALSQSITRLESDLGVRLIQRTTRRLSLTEAGQRFYRHCETIREIHTQALEDARSQAGALSGRLSITAPHALAAAFVRPAFTAFIREHPTLEVVFHSDDGQLNLVDHGIDLAIRVDMPQDQSLKVSKLGEFRDLLCAHKDLVAEHGGLPGGLADLKDWPHIGNQWQGAEPLYHRRGETALQVTPQVRCNAFHDVLGFVGDGLGVALLPDIAIREELRSGEIRALFPRDEIAPVAIYAAHAFDSFPPRRVTAFISALRQRLARELQ
ncbi:LysR family transcriptional regulator [Denitrobaculum tricleocarpae]|uniref:LysR family transcriptional regulator n=1 Tax=Denitrobaculum tricleocarpae TaxID=2591009 RepID=A0A545TL71_9PROT|nr:LysR family transcriptional regulator [Denitrobaculum tricleocarpae]TQV77936.1 LysR family transcriptional regulator [Denitrobaculum tricleocarpae]